MKLTLLILAVISYVLAILQAILIVLGNVDWPLAILIFIMNLWSGTYSLVTFFDIRRYK